MTYFVGTPECVPVGLSVIGRRCGNGVLDPGEQCDDANFLDGDCCSATCSLDAFGTSCTGSDVCLEYACDGAGSCVAGGPSAASCDDGLFCNGVDTCSAGVCMSPPSQTAACGDFTHFQRFPPSARVVLADTFQCTRKKHQESVVTTKLDGELKRELLIGRQAYTLTLSRQGLTLTLKGRRKGLDLAWVDLVSGEAALATALNASLRANIQPRQAQAASIDKPRVSPGRSKRPRSRAP